MQGIFPSPELQISSEENNPVLITACCSEPSLMTAQGSINPIQVCVRDGGGKKPSKSHATETDLLLNTSKNPAAVGVISKTSQW